jgi:hypothetical protein
MNTTAISIETEKEINTIAGPTSFVTEILRDNLSNLKKGKFNNYISFSNGLRVQKSRQGNYKENLEYFMKYDRCEKYRSVLKFFKDEVLVGEYPLTSFKKETEAEKRKRYQ